MAERAPAWLNSDHLTLLGFAAMLLVGLSYWLARWSALGLVLATFWLAMNWLGDSLDGTLARVRNRQRPKYGFYVDHVADMFGALFLVGGMMLSGIMSPAVGAALLVAFYMLSIEVYLATYTLGTFQLSFWKFSPTELRILLSIGNLALFWRGGAGILGGQYRLFDVGAALGAAAMVVTLVVSVIRHSRRLFRAEPIEKTQQPSPLRRPPDSNPNSCLTSK
jgi:phosphatidylglycerophosphate synthase